MKARLRTIASFCLCAMLALLTSCAADIFTDGPDEQIAPTRTVAFTVGDASGATRGVPVDNILQLKKFRADAYLHREGLVTPYFTGEEFYVATLGGVCRSDHDYLWPNEMDDSMDFVALAPYSVASGLTLSQSGDFTYTVPDNALDQVDLMLAKASGVECPAPGTIERAPVPLDFRHLLTQVRFVFGANAGNYWRDLTVHSVRMENLASTGTWDAAAGLWRNLDAQTHVFQIASAADGPGDGVRPYGTTEMDVWKKGYTMFLMPQTLPEGARVAIDISYLASESTGDSSAPPIERRTYYIYLEGKKLEPGHTVIVEINSNFTADCTVVNEDGTDVQLHPLPGNAQDLNLRLAWSGGGDALRILVAPQCQAYASVKTPGQTQFAAECYASDIFTLHVAENTSPDDRFIRLVIYTGHDQTATWSDHIVVLKQRGKRSGYGSFDDHPTYEDKPMPWGFDWPGPLKAVFTYSNPVSSYFEYDTYCQDTTSEWTTWDAGSVTFDFDTLRSLARTPNSASDGLSNTCAINAHCHFVNPFDAVRRFWVEAMGYDELTVGGTTFSDATAFDAVYGAYNRSAVMEAVKLNDPGQDGGLSFSDYVPRGNVHAYLPAIEELETIAASPASPLVAGRTYWSSTVDADGEPVALTVNAGGTSTRSKPGAGTAAWVHPVVTP